MKKRLLCHDYPTFTLFQHAIQNFFDQVATYDEELRTLMTENFTIFNLV
jgi:hypothetical protein